MVRLGATVGLALKLLIVGLVFLAQDQQRGFYVLAGRLFPGFKSNRYKNAADASPFAIGFTSDDLGEHSKLIVS